MTTGRDQEARQRVLPSALLGPRSTLLISVSFAALILASVVALATFGDHPFEYYSVDPARTMIASPLIGLMSHTGVLIAWGAAAICVFAGTFVARARGWPRALPLVLFGLGVGYVAIDDLFLFHDDIFPVWLHLPQKLVLFTYAALAIAFFWWYRAFFRRQEWPLLALALGVTSISFALDFEVRRILVSESLMRWAEDGTKLFGFALLAAYLVRLSARMLVDAYPRTLRAATEAGSRTDAATETVGPAKS